MLRLTHLVGFGGPTVTDTTAPTITSSASVSVNENATLSHSLTADETVNWSIVGGTDQAQFEISGSTLRWSSNGTRDYEAPADANTDNAYLVTVRAIDLSGNHADQAVTVTVTDVAEWVTTFTQTLNIDSTGWSGFNMRQLIAASLLSTSGSSVRITVEASSAAGFSIDGCYIGHQALSGDVYDFDGSQAHVLFSGAGTLSLSAGQTAVSDTLTFSLDETKNLVVAFHFNATSAIRGKNTITGADNYFKSAADETSTTNVSTYAASGSALRLVSKIEVL